MSPRICAALRRVRGVVQVELKACAGEALVTRRAGEASDARLLFALSKIGIRARVLPIEETTLRVCGMERPGCRQRVHRTLSRLRGVREVELKGAACAEVTYDGRRVGPPELVKALRKAGYGAEVQS